MTPDPHCECGRKITRRGASGMAPPKCATCMLEWATERNGVDLDEMRRAIA